LSHTGRRIAIAVAATVLLICAAELVAILTLNDRHLIYSLDDAAIHLAVAENIARGHYGVNLGEVSAPASSIAWPFLIAPFARLRFGEYAPLLINLPITIGTAVLFVQILARALGQFRRRHERLLGLVMTLILLPVTNIVGVLFTGMEHSLQVFLAVLTLFGIIREQETGRVPWWLGVAIVAGPLVRYENLALAIPALVYVAARAHWCDLVVCAGALAFSLGGFSVFLHAHGLGWLPSSVLVKSNVLSSTSTAAAIVQNFGANLRDRQAQLLGVAWLVLLLTSAHPNRSIEHRQLARWACAGVSLHLVAGTFGWYHRYEIYIWTTTLLTLVYLFGDSLRGQWARRHIAGVLTVLILGSIAAGAPYTKVLFTTPIACNNIYQQQYQMHRFLTEYWRAPGAVNDLGWTSYRNDFYVLDLYGLADREAVLRARQQTADWMDVLSRQRGVRLAMIYPRLVGPVPIGWTPLGELTVGRTNYSLFDPSVSFYALDPAAAARARVLLARFEPTLPAGARFLNAAR
jgi:hypothetical protein